jgi:carbon storage regulator CsrA
MLVLERKRFQKIFIGDDITITVMEIRNSKCRIGITAPVYCQVDRAEVRIARDASERAGSEERFRDAERESTDPPPLPRGNNIRRRGAILSLLAMGRTPNQIAASLGLPVEQIRAIAADGESIRP